MTLFTWTKVPTELIVTVGGAMYPDPPVTSIAVTTPFTTVALAVAQRILRSREEAGRFKVLGPAPAPVAKLRGEYRAQLFLKGTHRAVMREAAEAAIAAHADLRRRVSVDVDPVSIL